MVPSDKWKNLEIIVSEVQEKDQNWKSFFIDNLIKNGLSSPTPNVPDARK